MSISLSADQSVLPVLPFLPSFSSYWPPRLSLPSIYPSDPIPPPLLLARSLTQCLGTYLSMYLSIYLCIHPSPLWYMCIPVHPTHGMHTYLSTYTHIRTRRPTRTTGCMYVCISICIHPPYTRIILCVCRHAKRLKKSLNDDNELWWRHVLLCCGGPSVTHCPPACCFSLSPLIMYVCMYVCMYVISMCMWCFSKKKAT